MNESAVRRALQMLHSVATFALLALGATTFAAAPASFTISVNEAQTIPWFGVTAAWPMDDAVVDVAVQQGNVLLFGRYTGQTKIIVVSVTGSHTYDVFVKPRAGSAVSEPRPSANTGLAEVRYSSAPREVQTSVAITQESKNRRTEAQLRTVHQTEVTPGRDRPGTSIASASYRILERGRELTFFDRDVDHSLLTLANTPLRGIHYVDDHWRLHAGYTAYTSYRSFLIPIERQLVAGGGYAIRAGRSTFTPTWFTYRNEGNVPSLLYDYSDGERLTARAEVGYSHGLGAAAELAFDGPRDMVRASARYRPQRFASVGRTSPGFLGDASWSREYGRGSTFSTSWTATDIGSARVISGATDLDHRLTQSLSLTTGASWARFGEDDTLTIPAGVRLDFARAGGGALYRYTRSGTNRGGHGLRLAGRATAGRLYVSAYADYQQNAPTLDLIFAERPELALALAELGIVATSPADIARALREHAELAELGLVDGLTVHLAPTRTQLGFEASWLGASTSRQQLRVRLLRSVVESVARETTTTIATLTYSRRLTRTADLFLSYSYWRIAAGGEDARVQPFAEVGLRQRFDGLAALRGGTGKITGVVFADDDLNGRSDGTGVEAEVVLDGQHTVHTLADGSFAFTAVSRGSHRLVVRVPGRPEAYFTTPSRIEASSGDRVSFGVASTPAHLFGSVINDAGDGLGGVRVHLIRGAQQIPSLTASDGSFHLVAPPGEWQLTLLFDSVPPGYALAGTEPRAIRLDRATPAKPAYVLRAHRSISGFAAPHADVLIPILARNVRADEKGRFAFRSLPSGEVTLISGGVERRVTLSTTPDSATVDFTPPSASPAAAVVTVTRDERSEDLRNFMVQIGAYRVRSNADAAAHRARKAGFVPSVATSGALTIVSSGPYSRSDATDAAARLALAGMDAVVLPR